MSIFKKRIVSFVFLFLAISAFAEILTAQAQSPTILATVNGKAITANDLYSAMIQTYPREAQETLSRLVNEILIKDEAAKRKTAVTDAEVKKLAEDLGVSGELSPVAKRALETSLLTEKMLIAEKKIKVAPAEVEKFFNEKKELLGEQEQARLRQIFVLSEAEANDILLALNAGADFSKMAKLKSQDTASREKGGDLGFFARGMLAPEIEKTVFEMKPGETSAPIKTSAGFHIIKVEEKKTAKEAKLDADMKKRIEKIILNDKIQKELPAWLDDIKQKARIE